jgi:murein DD-endopeptidase MepM/ murein hydrolase activator NlpD
MPQDMAEPTPAPETPLDVKATPAEDGADAFVVEWKTATPVKGWIEYGSSPDKLDGIAFDNRGQDVVDTQHQVMVKGLKPNTGCYYVVVSGGRKYDNAGSLFKFLTGKETKLPGLPDEAAEAGEVTRPMELDSPEMVTPDLAQQSSTSKFLTLPYLPDSEVRIFKSYTSPSHEGIDYVKGSTSSTRRTFLVLAAADGEACGQIGDNGDCVRGAGNKVLIRHPPVNGVTYYTYYGHLGSIESRIPLGNRNSTVTVRRGQVIGTVGDTGASEVHLHFGLATLSFRWLNPYNDYWTTNPPSYSSSSDPDDRRMISSGQNLNGTINPDNDEDTYYFDASQGQLATIRMDRQNTTLDSYLYLYAPNGSLVNNPAADDDRGGNRNALIDHLTLLTTGRYLIRAKSWNGSSSGPYSLSLTIEASGGPPAPPSNLRATPIDCTHIRVDWNDNSNNESGFKIYDGSTLVATVGANTTSYTVGGLAPGSYHCFTVYAYNNYGNSAFPGWVCNWTPSCSCPVYRAEYYNNRYLSGSPTFVQCEDWPINHDWGSGGPGNGVGNDNFSARWTGRANIAAGTYTFIGGADDGIKVWLDGNVIINEWHDQGYTEYRVTRSFSSSGYHDIKVEYYENGGAARVFFKWEQASTPTCSGTAMSFEQTAGGSLSNSTPSRNYCFTASAGQWVSIRMFAYSGSLDTYIKLYKPDGQLFAEDDDGAGVGYNSFLVRQLPQSGTYRLEATRYGSTSGDYRLRLEAGREAALGDLDRNCIINETDRQRMVNAIGSSDQNADLNLDGIVNTVDYSILLGRMGRTCS